MITKAEKAMIDNDIERIVARATNPPAPETLPKKLKVGEYVFDESEKLAELSAYIIKQADNNDIKKLKPIFESGHGFGYIFGTLLTEMQKTNHTRKDLLKLAHYIILLLCVYDKENEKGE